MKVGGGKAREKDARAVTEEALGTTGHLFVFFCDAGTGWMWRC